MQYVITCNIPVILIFSPLNGRYRNEYSFSKKKKKKNSICVLRNAAYLRSNTQCILLTQHAITLLKFSQCSKYIYALDTNDTKCNKVSTLLKSSQCSKFSQYNIQLPGYERYPAHTLSLSWTQTKSPIVCLPQRCSSL